MFLGNPLNNSIFGRVSEAMALRHVSGVDSLQQYDKRRMLWIAHSLGIPNCPAGREIHWRKELIHSLFNSQPWIVFDPRQ